MSFIFEAVISKNHPSLAGHFPGNPIVPGVVLLDQVRIAVTEWRPGYQICALPQVKFHHPLLPEQLFTIQLQENKGKCSFTCQRGETRLAQGGLQLAKRS